MTISVFDITPNPVKVLSGENEMIIVTIFSTVAGTDIRLRFRNRKPQVADLKIGSKIGDELFSKSLKLKLGRNQVGQIIQFVLSAAVRDIGAIISMDVTAIDAADNEVSNTLTVLVTIGAI